MSSLRNGGAERSLVNLLQLFDYEKYDVDLVLFQEEGTFLSQLPGQVRVRTDCTRLHTLYETNREKIVGVNHPLLGLKHVYATLISKWTTNSKAQSRQYRWEYFYRKLIPDLEGHYDIAIAYMHSEQIYYLVDKVNADRKIGWVHIDYSETTQQREMDLKYFSRLDKVVTISEGCRASLKREFPGIAEKFVVLPNLTASAVVRSMAMEAYPDEFEEEWLQFVSIGRLNPQKGFDLAIRAAAILKKRGLKFRWYVLGDGEQKELLEKQRREAGVEDEFKFIGVRKNPYIYMKWADIVVQTSRYEGKSVVLDEAKILGKPIVVTDYSTVNDQIDENEGIVVGISPKEIADGIEKMISVQKRYTDYLLKHEYGNAEKIQDYYKLFEEA